MATITFTIPDAKLNAQVDAVCKDNAYQATINGVSNPETKSQFARRILKERWMGMVVSGRRKQAEEDAAIDLTVDIT